MNLINGEFKEAINDLDNLKDFIKRWEERVKDIKNVILSNEQALSIANNFLKEVLMKVSDKKGLLNITHILEQLNNDLDLALLIANNNYKKEFPSFWNSIKKLKLPKFELHKR